MKNLEEIRQYTAEKFKNKDYKCISYEISGSLVTEIYCYGSVLISGETMKVLSENSKIVQIRHINPLIGKKYTVIVFRQTLETIRQ